MSDGRSIILGPEHKQMTYVGGLADPWLKDWSSDVVFEQYGLQAREGGDMIYRSGEGRYLATLFKGRGSYLVILGFNLGLTRQRQWGEVFEDSPIPHRGFVIVDRAVIGGSLPKALHTMAEMIEKLTQGGYENHPDKDLIASATPLDVLPRPEAA